MPQQEASNIRLLFRLFGADVNHRDPALQRLFLQVITSVPDKLALNTG